MNYLYITFLFIFAMSASVVAQDHDSSDKDADSPDNILLNENFPDKALPDKRLRLEIARALFEGIEAIDAISIDVRDKTRMVKWSTFRDISTKKVSDADTWNDLYLALNNLHFGIINRHSFLLVDDAIRQKTTDIERWPAIDLGYTWPKISFFSRDELKQIRAIDGQDILELFEHFYNWFCNDAHIPGCLNLFKSYLGSGYFFLGGKEKITITFMDDTAKLVKKQSERQRSEPARQACADALLTLEHTLLYDGSQSCLFKVQNQHVIKILKFGKWGTDYRDIYCVRGEHDGMCQDINHIKRIINQSAPAPLVIDLQNNSGGSENTPWIAALTLNGFFDNQVKYRNIGYLQQSDIRENAFYYSQRAENWYRNLDHEALATEAFLPVRTDFCRGSEICEVKKIYSAKYPIQYTDVKLVINSRCVSSCDDFIWRMRQYTGAKTFGQLPATDGAYARLNGYLFVSDKNQVVNVILGEDMEPPKIKGQLWLRYRVPISKTVDQAGNNLEGEPSVLDYPLPVTMDNFHRLAEDNLQRAMFYAQ